MRADQKFAHFLVYDFSILSISHWNSRPAVGVLLSLRIREPPEVRKLQSEV